MKPTGVPPHERQFSLLKLSSSGLALAALLLGTCSTSFAESKELKDLTKARVERVRDVDGSIWEVQIVPRPLYQPKPFCPAPLDQAEPTPAALPLVPPVPGKKYDEAKTDEAAVKHNAPAKADKKGSELISFQDEKADKKAKKDDKKGKKDDEQGKEKAETKEPPFGVDIVPRFTILPHHPEEEGCLSASHCGHVHPDDYLRVYTSIPFLRSEYIANPSYRHEATMEILFGQLRPTVVHKHPGQPRPHETQFPFENDIIRPYSYYSLAPGAGYGRGPLPFAAPGAYGMNYNFYYPMPTVYRAY
jgi:hypothetical protein